MATFTVVVTDCCAPFELVVTNATLSAIVLPAYARSAVLVEAGIDTPIVLFCPGLSETDFEPNEYGVPFNVADS